MAHTTKTLARILKSYAIGAFCVGLLSGCSDRPLGGELDETGDEDTESTSYDDGSEPEDCRTPALESFEDCTVKCEGTPCKFGLCTQNCGDFYMSELTACEKETACLEAAQTFLGACPVDAGSCPGLEVCLDEWSVLVDVCLSYS